MQKGLLSVTKKVFARSSGKPLSQACSGKNVVRLTDCFKLTIDVAWYVKIQNQTKTQTVDIEYTQKNRREQNG